MPTPILNDEIKALFSHLDAPVLNVKAKQGKTFSGILVNSSASCTTSGFVYGSSDIPDGSFIGTSDVIFCGHYPEIDVYYIETLSKSRYIIATVEFNPHLSVSTASVKSAIESKQHHNDINPQYFEDLKWS